MFITAEMAQQELMTPPEFEEIQQLDINYATFRKLVRETLGIEEEDEADSEDVDETIGHAIAEHAERQLEIMDLDVIDDDDDEPVTALDELGETIAELIDENYEDAVDGINDLAEICDLDGNEIIGVISGQMALAPECLEAVASHFFADDEQAYQAFIMLGQEALEDAMGVPMVVSDGADYSQEISEMSADQNDLRAEFEYYRERDEIGSWMRRLERVADELYGENILTPVERNALLRSDAFRNDPDSVAVFCEFARNAGTSPQEYLANVEFCLNWKAQCGASNYGAFFNEMSAEQIVDVSAEEVEFVDDYRRRNPYS